MKNLQPNKNKISPFWEFCTARQRKSVNENSSPNIKVEIEWWDDAIQLVSDELRSVAGYPISWDTLVEYCRVKFLVLSRECPLIVDELVLAHIRDLIFQYFGASLFCSADQPVSSFKSAELGTKILAVSQLSSEILHIIKVEAGILLEPEETEESPSTVASVSLDYEFEDDVYENVMSHEKFSKVLNEAYCHLEFDHYNSVLNKCLKDLEDLMEDGTISVEKLLKKAKQETDEKDGVKSIEVYFTKLARKHMEGEEIKIQDVFLDEKSAASLEVLDSAKNLFICRMVNDLMGRVKK